MRMAARIMRISLSLRHKLAIYSLFVVFVSGAIATSVGMQLIDDHIISQAQAEVRHDLASAWMVYNEALRDIGDVVQTTSERFFLRRALTAGDYSLVTRELGRLRKAYRLDVLSVTDRKGIVVARTRNPYHTGDDRSNEDLTGVALKRKAVSATQIVPAKQLEQEGDGLAEQAFCVFRDTPKAKPARKESETSGMMLKAAVPILAENGDLLGTLYGGVLLNRNYEIVDRIKETVYKGEVYNGKDIGTATIFQWDVRIATNVVGPNGNRAIETRVSQEVYDEVLENGKSWIDRAFVVNDWYITAYEPIRDSQNRVIGILYVGILEQPYLDMKRDVIWSMAKYLVVAVVLVMGIAFLITLPITNPIGELVKATRQISTGHFPAEVAITSRDEIGTLSESFNTMSRRLKQTLDEKDAANEKLMDLNTRYLELLGFATHELMQPLGVLKGYLAMMQGAGTGRPLNTEQRQQAVSTMLRNVNMLINMSQTYLQLSKIESGELGINKQKVNVYREIVLPLVEDQKPHLALRNMSVKIENEEAFRGIEVDADPVMLKIVYNNLITNAAKYGREGEAISLGFEDSGADYRLNVRNEGEGIPEDKLEAVFDKFVRLEGESKRKQKGTGLGLFNAREIIGRHGGRMWAESVEGAWANFIFTLSKWQQA